MVSSNLHLNSAAKSSPLDSIDVNHFSDNPFLIVPTTEERPTAVGDIPSGKYLAGYTNISEKERQQILSRLIRVQMM
ncbi:unnamed protein product, partial [Didymodactylos carnosus]